MDSLEKLAKNFLRRTFDIRTGEYRRVLTMQLNIFMIIFTLMILKPVVNAQFVSQIGIEKLPYVFVIVALSALIITTYYSKALHRHSLRRVSSITLSLSIVLFLTTAVLLKLGIMQKLTLYVLFVAVANFGVLATSQFWIMANLAFDSRQAKRLFGFIGAGPIAGGVAGGYFISIVATRVDPAYLLILAGAILMACIPLSNKIWRTHIKPLGPVQRAKRLSGFGDHPLFLIRKSKHLTYLALIVGLGVIVAKLVEFQFSSVAVATYPDADELTRFFGFWYSTFNVASLIIQLLLTKRVVGAFGVGTSLFALPGGVLLGSVMMFFTPILWAGVFTKLWEVSIKQSINKSATELMMLPISSNIKGQVKSFIDVFIDLAATGIGGIILILVTSAFDEPLILISTTTIVIVAIWCWAALKLRTQYLRSFKDRLRNAGNSQEGQKVNFSDKSVIAGLRRALQSENEKQLLYVLSKVKEVADTRLYENVSQLLHHDSSLVRASALDCIYFLDQSIDPKLLDLLLVDPDHTVRASAFAQLLRQNKDNDFKTIREYLYHENNLIAFAALVGISRESRNNPILQEKLDLNQLIYKKLEVLNGERDTDAMACREMMLLAIGYSKIDEYYVHIHEGLSSDQPDIELAGIHAAGLTMRDEFIVPLVHKLKPKSTRIAARAALKEYGSGSIQKLLALVADDSIHWEIKMQIPSVIEDFRDNKAVEALLSLLEYDNVQLKLEVLRSLISVQKYAPKLRISKDEIIRHIIEEVNLYKDILALLYIQNQASSVSSAIIESRSKLIAVLEERLDTSLERIFHLLGLRYPPDDIIPAFSGLKSVNPDARSNSVEFLDTLLDTSLKKTLMPIVETSMDVVSDSVLRRLKMDEPEEIECLTALMRRNDFRLKMAVLDLIYEIREPRYADIILVLDNQKNPKIKERATEVMNAISKGSA